MQLCGSLSILWHCLSLGLERKLTFSSPVTGKDRASCQSGGAPALRPGAIAQSPGREAALAWASLAKRFPASSVLAREGAGHGIYYEAGNGSEALKGFGQMFKGSADLAIVYVSQSGLDSFNDVVETGVNIEDMWAGTKVKEFTVK